MIVSKLMSILETNPYTFFLKSLVVPDLSHFYIALKFDSGSYRNWESRISEVTSTNTGIGELNWRKKAGTTTTVALSTSIMLWVHPDFDYGAISKARTTLYGPYSPGIECESLN
ncbi:hypothetical protein RND71_035501 [Anisodus tanguticus]|uniref:Uncharacterized protein n=1 Tax=Anisodus tanguticus TaxID=243964 RepID=A0AAE1V291_9SOLA|nr:hypothetical protein RND71_035501 [Anisodus tanguticus]